MSPKTKILIVDDESITLDFFDVMLSKLGFDVIRAGDGQEALEKVKESNPDIVMTDNILPKITGWKFTEILKKSEDFKDFRDIPVIMLSAVSDVKDKIEGYDLGIEDYILKPFNFLEVLARIRAVLKSRELQKNVVENERKLTIANSLNESLIYFTSHMKSPIAKIEEEIKSLNCSNEADVKDFITDVQDSIINFNAAMTALEDEIKVLKSQEVSGQDFDKFMLDLETKFKNHVSVLTEEELTEKQ
ncbi:MAG: response regulator [Spirochaetales bacterium]|nr:response regulator [Spirochaetales bacterium]